MYLPAHARSNFSILGIPLSKKARHAKAVKKLTLARTKYLEQKQKALSKGKTPYPDDPKGPAKAAWKAWQKWRGKAGERAMKLAEAAEKKGRLDPQQAQYLQQDMAQAMADEAQLVTMPESSFDSSFDAQLTPAGVPTWALVMGGAGVTLGAIFVLRSLFRR